jgi:hypothetical protein
MEDALRIGRRFARDLRLWRLFRALGSFMIDSAILHSLKSIPLDAFARWWLLEDDPETSFGNLSFENRRRF